MNIGYYNYCEIMKVMYFLRILDCSENFNFFIYVFWV